MSSCLLFACAQDDFAIPEDSPLVNPLAAFPERLSDVGLFPDPSNLHQVPEGVYAYESAWPLWSNGSVKIRTVSFPAGAIDNSIPQSWEFAPGTIFTKTFLYPGEDGVALQPLETRILRIQTDKPEYGIYIWDAEGTDAVRWDENGNYERSVASDNGEAFVHIVPSYRQCAFCHEAASQQVLGFSEMQLNHLSGDSSTRWLDDFAEQFENGVPVNPASVDLGSAEDSLIAGYVYGNCVHCHDGTSGPNASFDLRPSVFLENTIDIPTESSASLAGIRIVPGDPEASVLFKAFRRDMLDELKAMPPLGVQRLDVEMVNAFEVWIEAL